MPPPWNGLAGYHHPPAAWQFPNVPDGAFGASPQQGGLLPPPSLLDELTSWPEADFDNQMMGSLRQLASEASAGSASSRSLAGIANLPGLPMAKERSGLSLSDLIKLRSTSDLNLSFTNSRSDLRDKNISEFSLGSVLDNPNGDLNDLLPEF